MTLTAQRILLAALVLAMAASGRAIAQAAPSAPQVQSSPSPSAPQDLPSGIHEPSLSSQTLFDFKDSDIKFSLNSLMSVLRDSRHEGWVLAAYPDPKTSRPLIGAGFGLDVAATEHIQRDPLNPHL